MTGHYDYAIGTLCFFKEGKDTAGETDLCFNEMPDKLYDYHSKSSKVLKMSRIFVEEDAANNVEVVEHAVTVDPEQLKVNKTYKDALNQFLQADQVESDTYDNSSEHSQSQDIDE